MANHHTCPYCQTANIPERSLCNRCGTPLNGNPITNDYIKLRQLEFLVTETADWPDCEQQREPYNQQLIALKSRAFPQLIPPEPIVSPAPEIIVPPAAPISEISEASAVPVSPASEERVTPQTIPEIVSPPIPAKPAAEPIPFDQWLLSERNIKFALYTGGLLLLLAGLIFVGVNWSYLAGPAKFAVTVMATGLLYLGGSLLYRRQGMRLGGIALLAVASGFVPLNVAVLQLYMLTDMLTPHQIWLFASPFCLLLYMVLARWTRGALFVYLCIAVVISAVAAELSIVEAIPSSYIMIYALLTLFFLLGAHAAQQRPSTSFVAFPLRIVAQLAAPLLFLGGAGIVLVWQNPVESYAALVAMLTISMFYVVSDTVLKQRWGRWVAAPILALTYIMALPVFGISGLLAGILYQVLALGYLAVGAAIQRRVAERSDSLSAALPLYFTAYAIAVFVTTIAMPSFGGSWQDFAHALIADVVILAASALVYRNYKWVYGAAWLLIAPVWIYAHEYQPALASQGLTLGIMLLTYVSVGYLLSRRSLWYGGPFLSVGAFLSVVVSILTWNDPVIAAIAITVISGLYLLMALALAQPWLLAPAVLALNIAITAALSTAGLAGTNHMRMQSALGALFGASLILSAHVLERIAKRSWAIPVAIIAIIQSVLFYGLAALFGGMLAAVLSVGFAALMLWMSWEHRYLLDLAKTPPLLTYVGLGLSFAASMDTLLLLPSAWQFWPVIIVGLCALFLGLGWLLNHGWMRTLFGQPLRFSGLVLLIVPLLGALERRDLALIAMSFALASIIMLSDACLRRTFVALTYIGLSSLIIASICALALAPVTWQWWPVFIVGLCALFLGLSWLLNHGWVQTLFGQPLHQVGLALLVMPLLGALERRDLAMIAITFTLGSLVVLSDTAVRRTFMELTYAGLGLLISASICALALTPVTWQWWPVFMIGLCALFLGLGWRLNHGWMRTLFGQPLRFSGLTLLVLPLVGASMRLDPGLIAITFVLASIVVLIDTALRRTFVQLTYAGLGLLISASMCALALTPVTWQWWPVFIVGLCALFLGLGWRLNHGWMRTLFGQPLRFSGLTLLVLPLVGASMRLDPGLIAITFVLASIIVLSDTALRRTFVQLTYAGLGLLISASICALALTPVTWQWWPVFMIGLCALFLGLSWLLNHGWVQTLFGQPLHQVGLALLVLPVVGASIRLDSGLIAITFALASVIVLSDAAARRILVQGYISGLLALIALWALLVFVHITEPQAYAAPLGLGLLALGWNELRLGRQMSYRLATLIGLLALLGTSFCQSISWVSWMFINTLDVWFYAALLLVESVIAIIWGVRTHSRGFVQVGGVALVVNALVQFGPAFVSLPRWIQIGTIGTILLGSGLLALNQREQLITVRRSLTNEWKQWQP